MASLIWHGGRWHEEQPMLLGPLDHAFWTASVVFDGGRAFGGLAPDLDLHCARLVRSADSLLLRCPLSAEEITALAVEGVRRFPCAAELYIKPVAYARDGFLLPEPESTEFVLCLQEMPLPAPTGISACFSSFRRPARDMAPTDAKAACLYPNVQRALTEARSRGFQQAIMLDPSGNVAEFATANIWIAKDGVAMTPSPNGTYLAGITRARVLKLLGEAGLPAVETTLTRADLESADEVFLTSNFNKVLPLTRIEDRLLQPGPVYHRARQLYFDFAKQCSVF